jgi:hypothetical protein
MSVTVNVNGVAISYPQTGDSEWGDEATDFAIQTGSALGKIGLSTGTSVDITSTLDVTGATTLDSTLTVAGTTTLNGTANLNGNTNLGNATSDTIAVTGILNVDSGTLYVNPTDNKVGINDSTPSEALDVTGNALISGTLGVTGNTTITGDVITSIVKASGSGGLTIDSNGGTDVALFGAGGGSGTTLYGGLNGTTATMSGVIFNSDGTAANPSIAFTSDTNTGLYRIGSDKIGITTNGARVGEIGVGYGGFTGNVIQVQSTALLTTTTFSTSFGDISGLSVAITPRYTTSKILIMCHINAGRSSDIVLYFKLLRDSTDICIGNAASNRTRSTTASYVSSSSPGLQLINIPIIFLDSPSTTSEIIYKIQAKTDVLTGYINQAGTDSDSATYPRTASTITVMEIQQ